MTETPQAVKGGGPRRDNDGVTGREGGTVEEERRWRQPPAQAQAPYPPRLPARGRLIPPQHPRKRRRLGQLGAQAWGRRCRGHRSARRAAPPPGAEPPLAAPMGYGQAAKNNGGEAAHTREGVTA